MTVKEIAIHNLFFALETWAKHYNKTVEDHPYFEKYQDIKNYPKYHKIADIKSLTRGILGACI